MTVPAKPAMLSAMQNYRDMAESCRKMAAVSRHPGPLLMRAQAYDEAAQELERTREQEADRAVRLGRVLVSE